MQEYKTSWREKICFGVGAIGLDLSYGMFYSFLSYYLSSVLGLKEAFLLLLTPIARIWDGINDPMMGTIVDNTRTKHGKYRPWILIGAICNAVVLFLLFTSFGMSGTKLYIYIGVMYILWGIQTQWRIFRIGAWCRPLRLTLMIETLFQPLQEPSAA